MEVDAEGLRRGDRAACQAVYDTHLADVLSLLHRGFVHTVQGERRFFKVASAFDREELCQEAFCEFFRQCQRGKFDTTRPIRPYLRRIVINLALRNAGRVYREALSAQPVDEAQGFEAPDALEHEEIVALMREFRAGLSEADRALVDLYAQEIRSQRAVGEQLGLSRDQVYRRLTRIRGAAMRFLSRKGWLDDA